MHGGWKQPDQEREAQPDGGNASSERGGSSEASSHGADPPEETIARWLEELDSERCGDGSGSGPSEASGHPGSEACLSDEQILAFVEGRLHSVDVSRVDHHLSGCRPCNALVVEALHACGLSRVTTNLSSRMWTLDIGTCIASRYVIRRCLGQGGIGDVYEALDLERQRAVAIKTARATGCDNPRANRRLASEAKLARRVRHPNVCRVYDIGLHREAHPSGGQLGFISMELIQGESLAQHLRRRGALSIDRFGALGRQLLAGVSAIHRAGVIHRDLKSHNLMLREQADLSVVIVDFGLAVKMPRAREEPVPASDPASSRSFEGSPAYMAPEQFWGAPCTPATDIFAAGVVMFEALTSVLPFRAFEDRTKADARRAPNEVPRRARSLAGHVAAPLDTFLARCLALDPLQRFASAAEALDALERALRGGHDAGT